MTAVNEETSGQLLAQVRLPVTVEQVNADAEKEIARRKAAAARPLATYDPAKVTITFMGVEIIGHMSAKLYAQIDRRDHPTIMWSTPRLTRYRATGIEFALRTGSPSDQRFRSGLRTRRGDIRQAARARKLRRGWA